MPKGESGLFVSYCAKDFLDGTQLLGPWEELAYRRICDMIYATNDRLQDDDRMLAWATKTGRRWAAIKVALTTGDRPKLMVVEGRITNKRCQSALGTAAQKIAQKRGAGEASARAGKSLGNLKQNRTDDREPVRESHRTEHRTYPLNQESKRRKKESPPSPSRGCESVKREFDEWYGAYPKRVGPKAAFPKYVIARKEVDAETLLAAAKRYAEKRASEDPKFTMQPSTWLHGGHWADEDLAETGERMHEVPDAPPPWAKPGDPIWEKFYGKAQSIPEEGTVH